MAGLAGAQIDTIPAPPGVTYIGSSAGGITNIGDFDGDGSDDVFCQWSRVNGYNYYNPALCIYSIKKKAYLMIDTTLYSNGIVVPVTGKLNSGSSIFVFCLKRYYIWNGTTMLGKKKVP